MLDARNKWMTSRSILLTCAYSICDRVGITRHLQPFVMEVVSCDQTYYSRTVVTPKLGNTRNQVRSINIAFKWMFAALPAGNSVESVQYFLAPRIYSRS